MVHRPGRLLDLPLSPQRDAWIPDPRVFADHGLKMLNGEPALFKRRESLRRDGAAQPWKERLRLDLTATATAWGAEVEP